MRPVPRKRANPRRSACVAAKSALSTYAIVIVIAIIFGIIIYWRIATKAGYAGALSLLMFVPLVSLVIIILFAFTEWPIERELREVRGGARMAMPTR